MKFDKYIAKVRAGEIPIDTHGHLSHAFEPRELGGALLLERFDRQVIEEDPQMEFPFIKAGNCLGKCAICGEEPSIAFCEDRVEIENNHFDVGPFSVDIEFPTGVMLFNDDLCYGFTAGDRDINTTIGIKQHSEDYAKQGMMHFFVGNSCPSIWRDGDTIYVGSLSDADGHKRIGSICTDLWWASFVDEQFLTDKLAASGAVQAEEYIKSAKKKGGAIEVAPGTYRCTSYYHVGDLDYGEEETQIYCKLEPKAS